MGKVIFLILVVCTLVGVAISSPMFAVEGEYGVASLHDGNRGPPTGMPPGGGPPPGMPPGGGPPPPTTTAASG